MMAVVIGGKTDCKISLQILRWIAVITVTEPQ